MHPIKKLQLLFITLASVLLAWFAWRQFDARCAPYVDVAPLTALKVAPPTSNENDLVQIFQRAFWVRPTSADKILHAQRREWIDANDAHKWQWFLVVEPSPALLKRLCDDNAFGLLPAAAVNPPSDAPEWFVFNKDEVSALQAPQAKLQLIFSKDKHTLYATDSGYGFRAGAPEPIKPAPQAPAPGRLPNTRPPLPLR